MKKPWFGLTATVMILTVCLLGTAVASHTYNFDSVSGNDRTGAPVSGSDKTCATPYQTIGKLNDLLSAGTIVAGDYIKFRRGTSATQQMFRGIIGLANCTGTADAPITITTTAVEGAVETYKPLMNSSTLANGTWTRVGSTGVYHYNTRSIGNINGLFENGLPLWKASTSACSDGDCYVDNTNKQLYYKPPSGHAPSEYTLEIVWAARTIATGWAPSNANNYFTIDGMKFTHEGIYIVAVDYCLRGWTIQNCDFNNTGISLWSACRSHHYWVDTTIKKCTFDHCIGILGGASMSFENSNNGPEGCLRLIVLNNIVTHNNTFPGRGPHHEAEWQTAGGDNDCICFQNLKDSKIIGNSFSGFATGSNNAALHYWEGGASAAWPITGLSNNGSGLIRVRTAGHDYITGDRVSILNVAGQYNFGNKIWTVTKYDSYSFDLQGSTYAGPYSIVGGSLNKGGSAALQEAQLPQTGNVVAKNYIHSLDGTPNLGIWWDSGTTYSDNAVQIYDNIIMMPNAGWGIVLARPQGGSICCNNTIYGCDYGIGLHTTNGWIIKNNIVANCRTYIDYKESGVFTGPTNFIDYNCYYPGAKFNSEPSRLIGGTLSQWKTASKTLGGGPWDAHSTQGDPKFINASAGTAAGFRLHSGSAAKGAGIAIVGLASDYGGASFASRPSMGAWEYEFSSPSSK